VLRRVTVGFQPRSVAVDPVAKRAFVVNYGQPSLSVSAVRPRRA